MYYHYYKSPIGILKIESNSNEITSLSFDDTIYDAPPNNNLTNPSIIKYCINELDSYFKGTLKTFSVPIKLQGTDFRIKVWNTLITIPFGQTMSYSEIAYKIGNPKAIRAVGGANHNNNITIIIPCHRVIGKDGKLTGYGGGLWRKEWLLEHEKNQF